jgi:hypothetical protein
MATPFLLKFNKDNAEVSWWRDDAGVVHFNVGANGGKSVVNGVVYYRVRFIDAYETEYHDVPAHALTAYHAEKIEEWERAYGIEWEAEQARKLEENSKETEGNGGEEEWETANEKGHPESKKRGLKRPATSAAKRTKSLGKFLVRERNDDIDDLHDGTDNTTDDGGEGGSGAEGPSIENGDCHGRETSADSIGEAKAEYTGDDDGRDFLMHMQQEAEAFFSQLNPDDLLVDGEEIVGSSREDISCDSIQAKLSNAYKESLLSLTDAAIEIPDLPCEQWTRRARDESTAYRGAWLKVQGVYILASMEDRVLKHLVDGDIPRAYRNDPGDEGVDDWSEENGG